jgi:hypothetical protein
VMRSSVSSYADVDIKRFAEHSIGSRVSQRCEWDNNSKQYDNDCEYSGGASRSTIGLPCGPSGYDQYGNSCRQALQIPRTHEMTLGVEREIIPGVALGLDGIYRAFRNQFDTRETNRVWNRAGSQLERAGTYRNGRNQTVSDLATPDSARRNYVGATFGVRKREGRVRVQASYTWSQLKGAGGAYGDIPAQDVFLWGYLPDDHRHELKALSTYRLTNWLTTGIRYSYRSGTPYNRLYRNQVTGSFIDQRASLGISPGTNINDPTDDRELRLPDLQSFNLQARLNLQSLIGQRFEIYVDVLNVFGLRTVVDVSQNDGPNFGLPTARLDPLRIRLGANYRY